MTFCKGIHAETVLIVEDDTLIRMDSADFLAEAGFHVLEAESADAAIAVLEGAGDVQLLFSDIDMPGSMDGLKLANIVHERWPKIRLLVTSGHHHVPNADLPDHGNFVAKPYDSRDVVRRIRALLVAAT